MFKNKYLSYLTALTAVCSFVVIPFTRNAQSFPQRSIRWIVLAPAGSTADIFARFVKAGIACGAMLPPTIGLKPD
jgi:tripartite-type tricarboxylate transporter receptor subunit TctC